MEKSQEKNLENHVLNVEVSSKNCITEKTKEIKPQIEDSNCNLTIIPSKDNLILDQINIIETCDKLNELSLNGPKRLLNGVESENEPRNSCTNENLNLQDSSSHCKTCVNASDNNKYEESAVSLNKIDDEQKPNENNDNSTKSLVLKNGSTNSDIFETPNCTKSIISSSDETPCCSNTLSEKQENSSKCDGINEKQSVCGEITYVSYESELQMPDIMRLIQKDLSEPYSIYTYRYFIHNWPQLCFLAMDNTLCVGAIVCKLDMHRKVVKRGYIAMLAVDEKYRKRKIGSNLVLKAIRAMVADGADEDKLPEINEDRCEQLSLR
ncbi:hypothetical protein O3M35_003498 [Rhynocoris fuscipes]|uniref:N-acetyltransferase domain-containing protein n=1 Tax=Rhynocoris fuscipes TaxID=488301 RepID=A0AAW1CMN4_9HEMI